MSDNRQHAHQLIDQLPEAQVSALVGLLETILGPLSRALGNALSTMNQSPKMKSVPWPKRENRSGAMAAYRSKRW